jgi:hypothetical protein
MTGSLAAWPSPPGYQHITAEMQKPRFGWAVITAPGGSGGAHLAVITVMDWHRAKRTMPYRWLNSHPRQPAPVSETLALAEETWKTARPTA